MLVKLVFVLFFFISPFGMISSTKGAGIPMDGGDAQFQPPEYGVSRVAEPPEIDGHLNEPAWFAARTIGPFQFPWHQQGPREPSIVKALWDDQYLYLAHVCRDRHITARYRKHNDPIPEDDCFEIMLAPDPARPLRYFNIEWNLLGGYIDGHRPEGPQGPRVDWDCQGLKIAGTIAGTANDDSDQDQHWIVEVAIPLENFKHDMPHMPPHSGDRWRVNFNRHGGVTNPQYSQWSSSDTPAPAFHVPHRFGTLIFMADVEPFAVEAR